jgi:hypothetical protein
MPSHLSKNNKDIEIPKTISYNNNTDSLSQFIQDALVGEFLGDGSLQFNKKDQEGKPKPNTNAYLSITLKSKDHITHLYEKFYKSICPNTGPIPWPNPKTGKPITQYKISTRTLPSLTNLHKEWYYWNDLKKN